ncbi:hypothetical protein [Beggiatoa leptomitoformis]|uniref:DUF3592 domain-containing protein n=1 Tax=Beggiatoa leptomitoformis TaxID=288004 RepID=A0A2N9YB56_9GAMM|nr:hypothetical protein [Beggiatoa leptomitoformis]ALG66990.1 hypothetical protein AL038_03725 [Beggiatoa leptomitoformis]AUI67639.1 hypothetical protein BLE401_02295 [Beggiatoa leptomitoformis]
MTANILFLLATIVTILMIDGMLFVFLSSKIADLQMLQKEGKRVNGRVTVKNSKASLHQIAYEFEENHQTYQNVVYLSSTLFNQIKSTDTVVIAYQGEQPSENYLLLAIENKIEQYHHIMRMIGISLIIIIVALAIYWWTPKF